MVEMKFHMKLSTLTKKLHKNDLNKFKQQGLFIKTQLNKSLKLFQLAKYIKNKY